jgi:glyoxylase I family protein
MMQIARHSHIGISISDMEHSLAFYKEGFGFVDGVLVQIENKHNALFGLDGPLKMQSRFLRLGELVIELIEFTSPAAQISPEMRALNHTGLTHLSFRVADVDQTASRLAALGGKVHPSTRTTDDGNRPKGEIVFCTDPDGTRIELMYYPDDVKFA